MYTETHENRRHTLVRFDTFEELLARNETAVDHRSASMSRSWAGAESLAEAITLARQGLPAEGIEALAIAENNVNHLESELITQQFQSVYSECGSDVDVARYLSGEPECMISHYLDDRTNVRRIVSVVIGLNVPSCVSASAITKHGHALMSLVEAIERAGLQAEIWADSTVHAGGYSGSRLITGRIATRIKAAGEPFDAGMFMFVLTHASFLRGIILNTMHEYPADFRSALGVRKGSGYGSNNAQNATLHPEDYPDGSIVIPAIMADSQAGTALNAALKKLGLLAE